MSLPSHSGLYHTSHLFVLTRQQLAVILMNIVYIYRRYVSGDEVCTMITVWPKQKLLHSYIQGDTNQILTKPHIDVVEAHCYVVQYRRIDCEKDQTTEA